MLDAYSSLAMPLMYNHWSFGKTVRARGSALPRRLLRARLRDRDQFQPVHLLPAGRKHDDDAGARDGACRLRPQSLLQEQLSLPAMDQCRRHSRLSLLRQEIHRRLRGALRPRRGRSDARLRARADGPGRVPLSPAAASRRRSACWKSAAAAPQYDEEAYNELWRTLPAGVEPPSVTADSRSGGRVQRRDEAAGRKSSLFHREEFALARRPGSARRCASCATWRSISIRSASSR